MGQPLEFNDTIKINKEQGFPTDVLNFEKHQSEGILLEDIADKVFTFEKQGFRIYHHSPVRCFLVEEREEKWLYWGTAEVLEQTNYGGEGDYKTKVSFKVLKLYSPEDQIRLTKDLAKDGLSYFE